MTVRVVGAGLDLTLGDGTTVRWPLDQVRQTQGAYAGEPVRLERGTIPETLLIDDPGVLVAIGARPRRRRARLALTLAALAGVLVASVAIYAWGIPAAAGLVARWVPVTWEDRVGAAVVDRLAPPARRCVDPSAQAALDTITRRLLAAAGPVPYRLRVVVADDPAVNAFAAPGGHLVLFRGLLEQSRSPEELAGVLAHELQHVLRRHATRAILERASTAVVVAALGGDVSGVMTLAIEGAYALGAMAYRRAHETEADAEGLRLLLAARIDPAGMIGFFDERRVLPPGAAVWRYLVSHPPSAERAATLRDLARAGAPPFTPLLDDPAWRALARMCRS